MAPRALAIEAHSHNNNGSVCLVTHRPSARASRHGQRAHGAIWIQNWNPTSTRPMKSTIAFVVALATIGSVLTTTALARSAPSAKECQAVPFVSCEASTKEQCRCWELAGSKIPCRWRHGQCVMLDRPAVFVPPTATPKKRPPGKPLAPNKTRQAQRRQSK